MNWSSSCSLAASSSALESSSDSLASALWVALWEVPDTFLTVLALSRKFGYRRIQVVHDVIPWDVTVRLESCVLLVSTKRWVEPWVLGNLTAVALKKASRRDSPISYMMMVSRESLIFHLSNENKLKVGGRPWPGDAYYTSCVQRSLEREQKHTRCNSVSLRKIRSSNVRRCMWLVVWRTVGYIMISRYHTIADSPPECLISCPCLHNLAEKQERVKRRWKWCSGCQVSALSHLRTGGGTRLLCDAAPSCQCHSCVDRLNLYYLNQSHYSATPPAT